MTYKATTVLVNSSYPHEEVLQIGDYQGTRSQIVNYMNRLSLGKGPKLMLKNMGLNDRYFFQVSEKGGKENLSVYPNKMHKKDYYMNSNYVKGIKIEVE